MTSLTAGTIGLLFFFVVFVGIAVWTFSPKNKRKIEKLKNIPLKDD